MRGIIVTLLTLALVAAVPTVAADENPSLSVPATEDVAAAAEGTAGAQRDTTTGFTQATWSNASAGANEAQTATLPSSEAVRIFEATGAFGGQTIANGQALANGVVIWSHATTGTKISEGFAFAAAGQGIGEAAVIAGADIVHTGLRTACSSPIGECKADSLVGVIQEEAFDLVGQGESEADSQSTDSTEAAIGYFLSGIIELPEDEE